MQQRLARRKRPRSGKLSGLWVRRVFQLSPLRASMMLVNDRHSLLQVSDKVFLTADFQIARWVLSDRHTVRKALPVDQIGAFKQIWGRGFVTGDGDDWLAGRGMLQSCLQSGQDATYRDRTLSHTERMLGRWGRNEMLDTHDELMNLSFSITVHNVFGRELPTAEHVVVLRGITAILRLLRQPGELASTLRTPAKVEFERAIAEMDDVVLGAVRSAGQGDDRRGLVHALSVRGLTDHQIRDEVVTALRAGHRDSATTVAWTVALLAECPDVQDRVAARCHCSSRLTRQGVRPTGTDATVERCPRRKYADASGVSISHASSGTRRRTRGNRRPRRIECGRGRLGHAP